MNNKEIERKFLVKYIPKYLLNDLHKYECSNITQCYINDNDNDSIITRARNIDDKIYTLDFKNKGLLERLEYSISITEEQWKTIYEQNKNKTIFKKRYVLNKTENSCLTLDIYQNKDLKVVEYECDNIIDVLKFEPDVWYKEDITTNNEYKNSYLALKNNYII